MRTKKEILNDELSENMVKVVDEYPGFRKWIYDAMEEWAKEVFKEFKKTNSNE